MDGFIREAALPGFTGTGIVDPEGFGVGLPLPASDHDKQVVSTTVTDYDLALSLTTDRKLSRLPWLDLSVLVLYVLAVDELEMSKTRMLGSRARTAVSSRSSSPCWPG